MGHFVELAGIATSGISLIREHSLGFRPPRALWVPFPLGRPFGAPNEPAFQTEVLESLFALFNSEGGPSVLGEFPKEAPKPDASKTTEAFGPANWSKPTEGSADVIGDAKAEVARLSPHHASWVGKPGNRSIAGASGLDPLEIIDFLGDLLSGAPPALPPNAAGSSPAAMIRLAGADLRHWCIEAAMDSPSQNLSINAIDDWFWGKTACAAFLLRLQVVLAQSDQEDIAKVATAALIPREQHHRLLKKE